MLSSFLRAKLPIPRLRERARAQPQRLERLDQDWRSGRLLTLIAAREPGICTGRLASAQGWPVVQRRSAAG